MHIDMYFWAMFQCSRTTYSPITWLTNYEWQRQRQKKFHPIVHFFTGTKWCTWCNKLEEEVLDTPEFAELAGKQFVFLKLDFPKKDLKIQTTSPKTPFSSSKMNN